MRSSDHHINPDFQRSELQIKNTIHDNRIKLLTMTEDTFKQIQVRDPNTIYVVHQPDGSILTYAGDALIKREDFIGRFMIGYLPDTKTFPLYKYESNIYGNELTKICEYNNAHDAINAMLQHYSIGSIDMQTSAIYDCLIGYISNGQSLIQTVFAILNSTLGCAYDPGFQKLQDVIKRYQMEAEFSYHSIAENSEPVSYIMDACEYNPIIANLDLYKKFKGIVNVAIAHDYFAKQKEEAKQNEYPNFTDEVQEILKICRNS